MTQPSCLLASDCVYMYMFYVCNLTLTSWTIQTNCLLASDCVYVDIFVVFPHFDELGIMDELDDLKLILWLYVCFSLFIR